MKIFQGGKIRRLRKSKSAYGMEIVSEGGRGRDKGWILHIAPLPGWS